MPIVVLIDRDTASAAEILDRGAGRPSRGDHRGHAAPSARGPSRRSSTSTDGGALDLTVGEYFTADGTSLAGKGITPDVTAAEQPEGHQAGRGATEGARRAGREHRPSRTGESSPGRRPGAPRRERGAAGPLHGRRAAVRARAAGDPCRGSEGWAWRARARRLRGARRQVLRPLGSAERARDVVDALLWDRGTRPGLHGASSRTRRAMPRPPRRELPVDAARPDRARRPSPSTRRPRATSTTRSRPRPRATASGSGSTSPTWPPTCGRAARWTPRRFAAAPAPTCPGTVEPMLPRALSDDACSLAPGVERLAVTAEIELGGERRAAVGELLPQPDPLRRASRLRPARRDLRRARPAARRGRRRRSGLARRAAAALAAPPAGRVARGRVLRAGVRVRRRRRGGRAPTPSSRPRPTG